MKNMKTYHSPEMCAYDYSSLGFYKILNKIVYYSVGFTEPALYFGGELAKVRRGVCLLGAKYQLRKTNAVNFVIAFLLL